MVKRKQDWVPATTFTTVKLKANGPKAGQSVEDWQRGKDKEQDRFDAAKARKLQRGEL
jgi:hypothetical protein